MENETTYETWGAKQYASTSFPTTNQFLNFVFLMFFCYNNKENSATHKSISD
jgi:hypothetical protein